MNDDRKRKFEEAWDMFQAAHPDACISYDDAKWFWQACLDSQPDTSALVEAQTMPVVDAAILVCAFCKMNGYPKEGTEQFFKLTELVDKLDTALRIWRKGLLAKKLLKSLQVENGSALASASKAVPVDFCMNCGQPRSECDCDPFDAPRVKGC